MSRWTGVFVAVIAVLAGVVWADAPRPARAQGPVWTLAGTTQTQEVTPPSMCFSTEATITNVAATFITTMASRCGEFGVALTRHRWGEAPATLTPGQTVRWNMQADVSGSADTLWVATTKLAVLGGEEIVTAKAGDTLLRNIRQIDWTVPGLNSTGELVLVVRADTGGRGWVETRWRYTAPGGVAATAAASAPAAAATAATPYEPVLRPQPSVTLMGPTAATAGREVTYTVLLRNDGNGAMTGVSLTLGLGFAGEIAGGTRLVSARGAAGAGCAMSENEPVVSCAAPSLLPGTGAVLEITVKAPDNANVITATAAVRSAEQEQPVASAPVETAIS